MRFQKTLLSATLAAAAFMPYAVSAGKGHSHHGASHHNKPLVASLADAARQSRRLVGTAASHSVLNSADATFEYVLTEEFNYITPENVGKWGPLQPNAIDEWFFDSHDEMVDFAMLNDLKYKGHALVWHSQAPDFVTDDLSAAELQAAINAHIETTVSRYKGQIYAWDVVNEAIGDDAQYRDSVLYRTLGESFIADAFYAADAIDHKAKLYYNDYNIAGINAKSDKVYEVLKGLVDAGVPIDGIGFQAHLVASSAPSYAELVENFTRFAELGLRVNISELDVRISNLPWDKATNFAIQRQVYHRVVAACMSVPQCEAITTWGISDQYSWIDYTFGADDPLAWDEQYQKKPAYFGMVDGFMGINPDSEGTMPNLIANGNAEAGLDGWSTWTGELSRVDLPGRRNGNAVKVSNRSDSWDGAIYDISAVVRDGQSYDAAIWVRIDDDSRRGKKDSRGKGSKHDKDSKHDRKNKKVQRADVQLNAKVQCVGEDAQYISLDDTNARFNKWSRLAGELALPDCELESAAIYVSGAEPDIDLIVDRASLRPQMFVPDDKGYGPNIVSNPFFEESAEGWFGFGDAVVEASAFDAQSGAQSLYVSNRLASWQGPATSLLENATPGDIYELFSWVSVDGNDAWVNATVKATCPDGDQYINITGQTVYSGTWTLLRGTFEVPDCELSDLVLYFEGPAADSAMYLDDVYVRMDLEASSDNIISNGGFENGATGWQAWGGATITAATDRARSGDASGLLSNRSATWQGPVYDLLSDVAAGGTYEVSAWGMVSGVSEDTMNITVKTACAATGDSYHQLASTTVNDATWTQLQGSIVLPDCTLTQVLLYFDGPAAGVDVYLDDVEVTGTEVPEPTNLVGNSDFESGIDGWISWGGNLSASTAQANSGNQSALLSARVGSWEGPVYDLLAAGIQAGASYDISAWGRISGVSLDSMSITLKVTCDDGASDYLWGGAADVSDAAWSEVAGSVTVPDCTLTEASLYFGGPAQAADIYLDDVSVVAQ